MSRTVRTILTLALALTWTGSLLAADGAATYKARCAMCHAADGSGNTPAGKALHTKALNSPDVQKLADADLFKTIHDGRNKMPAFAGKLSDDDIRAVVTFIRTFGK
ncbi:MAG TPA: cytochrome c [Thermoanaerobaculia bacterium]|nr:cytochrome c [Thermoanaerobaculia bacterium]